MKTAALAVLFIPMLAAAPASAATPTPAAVPNSIAALLGPTVGYLMSQSDLCGWHLADKMTATYTAGFKTIGLTAEQEASVWKVAQDRRTALDHLSAAAKKHMKAETCTAASRARVEHNLD